MRTALRWALLVAGFAATSYLAHRTWPSHAEATILLGGDAGRAAGDPEQRPWSRHGFRDGERCVVQGELYGESAPCL
ncbi:MAG TPA: hypothetical protein VFP65_28715 [Anaeromyxobacteraceae bacterium]|nr:hypothetical protein [Anaeromyxobacteraceae bacterium]